MKSIWTGIQLSFSALGGFLGWYLGGMALVALVALAFFRESKDVDFEQ